MTRLRSRSPSRGLAPISGGSTRSPPPGSRVGSNWRLVGDAVGFGLCWLKTNPRAHPGRLGEAFQGARRRHDTAAHEACHHRRCRPHGPGNLLPRHIGFTTRLDQRAGEGDLVLAGVLDAPKSGYSSPSRSASSTG